ncbi:MAG TPA: sigma-70 family RNA polymerase sigma factor [Vicinamibacteria bacterium]|nr:sigma-70 family RNA polymerase sigma factor [Vicinamibacteria bacterium]
MDAPSRADLDRGPDAGRPAGPAAPDAAEAELLARARDGNLFAFDEMVRRYQRRVYATAVRIVRRHDVADDVVQEAFLRAHQSLDRFDLSRPFGPWICRIAANLAVNHVRSPRAREEGLPEAHAETPSAGASPLTRVLDAEARRELGRALESLSDEQRAVFVLRVFDELSYKEIAQALEISMGTVMSRLSRARERLREALTPYLGAALARRAEGGRP